VGRHNHCRCSVSISYLVCPRLPVILHIGSSLSLSPFCLFLSPTNTVYTPQDLNCPARVQIVIPPFYPYLSFTVILARLGPGRNTVVKLCISVVLLVAFDSGLSSVSGTVFLTTLTLALILSTPSFHFSRMPLPLNRSIIVVHAFAIGSRTARHGLLARLHTASSQLMAISSASARVRLRSSPLARYRRLSAIRVFQVLASIYCRFLCSFNVFLGLCSGRLAHSGRFPCFTSPPSLIKLAHALICTFHKTMVLPVSRVITRTRRKENFCTVSTRTLSVKEARSRSCSGATLLLSDFTEER
jgi:hypothetical protein